MKRQSPLVTVPPVKSPCCTGNNHSSDVFGGTLKFIQRGINLSSVKIDKAQRPGRKMEFATLNKFHQQRQFSGKMIGHADDLDFFVDQLGVGENRQCICS